MPHLLIQFVEHVPVQAKLKARVSARASTAASLTCSNRADSAAANS